MDGYQELNQRNFKALSEGLKSVRTDNQNNAEEIKELRRLVGELSNKISALQAQNGALLARFHGTGGTA